MTVVAVLCAAATDRFYIEDFTIATGETKTVSILLENEATYTAFQTDIYMPASLTIEMEDGDYIFDLTDRKSRDHMIASQLQADGAIRVISYSNRINPYSGNSGALVTFNVTAAEDFTGSSFIALRGTLLTTTSGQEVSINDEICTVTSSSTVKRGDVNGNDAVNMDDLTVLINYLLTNDDSLINIANAASCNNPDSDIVDMDDLTALINYLLTNTWQ